MDRFEPNIPSECQELSTDNHEDIRPDSSSNRVIIIEAMAILQGMKKTSGMTTIGHLKKAFLDKIMRLSNDYDETRLIFDHYIENSLKSNTRTSRAASNTAENDFYDVHDEKSFFLHLQPKATLQFCFLKLF